MQIRSKILIGLLLLTLSASCSKPDTTAVSNMAAARQGKADIRELRNKIKDLEPFFERMRKPARFDWLASRTEPGQTFDEYLDSDPTRPTQARQKIYVLPLGRLNALQQKATGVTSAYLAAFYDLPVIEMPMQPLEAKTPNVRNSRSTGRQVRTGHILDDILKPMLPSDAAVLIAFTADDLYPNDSMNFVFGQASLEERVGVWSLDRLDDNTDKSNFLLRVLKISAHETGHMFSMAHCTKYECLMSGTNHLGETDRRPFDTCPECTAKICWFSDIKVADRYRNLIEFCRKNGLVSEAKDFERKLNAVERD